MTLFWRWNHWIADQLHAYERDGWTIGISAFLAICIFILIGNLWVIGGGLIVVDQVTKNWDKMAATCIYKKSDLSGNSNRGIVYNIFKRIVAHKNLKEQVND